MFGNNDVFAELRGLGLDWFQHKDGPGHLFISVSENGSWVFAFFSTSTVNSDGALPLG